MKCKRIILARTEENLKLTNEINALKKERAHLKKKISSLILSVNNLEKNFQSRYEPINHSNMLQNASSAGLELIIIKIFRKFFPKNSFRFGFLQGLLKHAERIYGYGFLNALKMLFPPRKIHLVGRRKNINVAFPADYAQWIKQNEPNAADLEKQILASESYNPNHPLFSVILPVYKVRGTILKATLNSLIRQSWKNWECCVVYTDLENKENWTLLKEIASSESRIKLLQCENGGISNNSNSALKMAVGEYIALLDHDDELSPWSLYIMAEKIIQLPQVDFLYSDKDRVFESGYPRHTPLFKPQWSPEMLFSVNYLTHLNVIRRKIVQAIGGWDAKTDGAQDWDLFLRAAEKSQSIERVVGIGYHWRMIEGSTSTGIIAKPYAAQAQLTTLESLIKRKGLSASIRSDFDGFHVHWHVQRKKSIDLVLYGHAEVSEANNFLYSLLKDNQEVIQSITRLHSENNLHEASLNTLPSNVHINEYFYNEKNFTQIMDEAIEQQQAPVILFVDLSVKINEITFKELIGWTLMHPEIAFTGGVLFDPSEKVWEAGRVVGDDLNALPLFRGVPLEIKGIFGGPLWYRNVSAVSPMLASFKRSAWCLEPYLDLSWSQAFTGCCKNALSNGQRGLVNPFARGYLKKKLKEELNQFNESYNTDPYFHPAFKSIMPLSLTPQKNRDQ